MWALVLSSQKRRLSVMYMYQNTHLDDCSHKALVVFLHPGEQSYSCF